MHRVLPVPGRLPRAAQPRDASSRSWARASSSARRPRDASDRPGRPREYLKDNGGIGYCNITKCCTEVCPEHIKITDNAIIPLKERVADEYYDPIQWVWRKPPRVRQAGSPCGRGACPGRPGRRAAPPTDRRIEPSAESGPTSGGAPADVRLRSSSGPTAPPAAIRTGLARSRPDRRRRGRTPASARGARRLDLGLPRRPDEQRRRVHRRGPGPRSPASSARRGLDLLLDSKLIVEQLAGRWRVKDAKLIPLWEEARRTLRSFGRWSAITCRGPRTRPPTRWRTRRSIASPPRAGVGGPAAGNQIGEGGVRCGMIRASRRPRLSRSSRCSQRAPAADVSPSPSAPTWLRVAGRLRRRHRSPAASRRSCSRPRGQRDGCNQFFGGYTYAEGSISFTQDRDDDDGLRRASPRSRRRTPRPSTARRPSRSTMAASSLSGTGGDVLFAGFDASAVSDRRQRGGRMVARPPGNPAA